MVQEDRSDGVARQSAHRCGTIGRASRILRWPRGVTTHANATTPAYTENTCKFRKHLQIQKTLSSITQHVRCKCQNTCKFRKTHANSENPCIDFITRANRETNCKLWQRKCVPGDHNQWRTHIRLAVLFNYEGVKSFDCATRGTCFSFIMIMKWFCVFSTY